jgi:hypothetical protein
MKWQHPVKVMSLISDFRTMSLILSPLIYSKQTLLCHIVSIEIKKNKLKNSTISLLYCCRRHPTVCAQYAPTLRQENYCQLNTPSMPPPCTQQTMLCIPAFAGHTQVMPSGLVCQASTTLTNKLTPILTFK